MSDSSLFLLVQTILRQPSWQQDTLKSVPTRSQWRHRRHSENVAIHSLLPPWIYQVCCFFSLPDHYFCLCGNPFSLVKECKENQIMRLLFDLIYCCSSSGLFVLIHQLITWSSLSSFPWSLFLVSCPSSLSFATDTGRGKQVNTIFLCILLNWCLWWCCGYCQTFVWDLFSLQYQTESLSSHPKASVDGQVVDISGRFSQSCLKGALH